MTEGDSGLDGEAAAEEFVRKALSHFGQIPDDSTVRAAAKRVRAAMPPYLKTAPARRSPRTRSERIEALAEWLWSETRHRVGDKVWDRADFEDAIPRSTPLVFRLAAEAFVDHPERVAAIARGERP